MTQRQLERNVIRNVHDNEKFTLVPAHPPIIQLTKNGKIIRSTNKIDCRQREALPGPGNLSQPPLFPLRISE